MSIGTVEGGGKKRGREQSKRKKIKLPRKKSQKISAVRDEKEAALQWGRGQAAQNQVMEEKGEKIGVEGRVGGMDGRGGMRERLSQGQNFTWISKKTSL